MPEYLAPGVFVEETSFRSKSIEGVSTSTSAFVGPMRKGPLGSTPDVITSFGEFTRVFGGLENLSFASANDTNPDTTNYLAHSVQAFFNNGGKRLYVTRTFIPRTDGGGNVISDGVAKALVKDTAPGSPGTAEFIARMPGAGLNGTIDIFEKETPVAGQTNLVNAPAGSLLRTGGTPAGPATVAGGKAPFNLHDGDQLSLTTNSGTESITFNGAAAEVTGEALADPIDITPGNNSFTVTINSSAQTITLATGSTALADLLDTINVNLQHGYARLDSNQLVIGTDRQGSSADILVAANSLLGFDSNTSSQGTGNVADLEQITVNELNALLPPTVVATLTPDTGMMNLVTTATGDTVSLQVDDTTARTPLGLSDQASQGTAGNAVGLYEKSGSAWTHPTEADLTVTANTTGDLLTLNVVMTDGDGTTISYDNLGFGSTHPMSLAAVLAEAPSSLSEAQSAPYAVKTTGTVSAHEFHASLLAGKSKNSFGLTGGNDGAEPVTTTTIAGADSYRDGLRILEEIDDISIIAAPGHSAFTDFKAIQLTLLSHAERMRYRIAILDPAQNASKTAVRETRSHIDSKYGALYYPWIMVANPLARPGNSLIKKELALPPSGFMAGIYARTDTERGVWKAPANEVVRGALRFEREITHGQQEVLNPEGINCLRSFFGRGNRVWGARTVSSDPEWKYVNIRRYFIYLEHSIEKSTQWSVFEPNGLRLWANIKDTVTDFLYNEWRSGALAGATPEQGFFVRCDRSTMTQNDLDNGRLICEIGVAALRPAEFIIFRIGQKTADANG